MDFDIFDHLLILDYSPQFVSMAMPITESLPVCVCFVELVLSPLHNRKKISPQFSSWLSTASDPVPRCKTKTNKQTKNYFILIASTIVSLKMAVKNKFILSTTSLLNFRPLSPKICNILYFFFFIPSPICKHEFYSMAHSRYLTNFC